MKINAANVANPSMTESALWCVRPGIALLAPTAATVQATGLSHGAYGVDAVKRFAKTDAEVTGSPQSRGRLART